MMQSSRHHLTLENSAGTIIVPSGVIIPSLKLSLSPTRTILWQFTEDGQVEIECRLLPEFHGKGYGKVAFAATGKRGFCFAIRAAGADACVSGGGTDHAEKSWETRFATRQGEQRGFFSENLLTFSKRSAIKVVM